MAILRKIVVSDFRNIKLSELEFSPNINCISGGNGEGKTNLLDAIYYLSMTKSAFNTSDRFNFRYGTDMFAISGKYAMLNAPESVFSIQVSSSGEKKVKVDGKPYSKISDHIGKIPVVIISPADSSMVSDSGEERRRFMNGVLSQMYRSYLSDMQQYNKILLQRNRLLKGKIVKDDLLEVYDERLADFADNIFKERNKFVESLCPIIQKYYADLSGDKESISIVYSSDLQKGNLRDLLSANREKDRILGYTSSGIQRDDLLFKLNGHSIRRCGSQGQQKSFLVSLKFAQYEIMKKNYGFSPILLLDDVFDKLDMDRISNLLSMVSGNEFGQIFITDSNKVRMSGIVDNLTEDRSYFVTECGNFKKESF